MALSVCVTHDKRVLSATSPMQSWSIARAILYRAAMQKLQSLLAFCSWALSKAVCYCSLCTYLLTSPLVLGSAILSTIALCLRCACAGLPVAVLCCPLARADRQLEIAASGCECSSTDVACTRCTSGILFRSPRSERARQIEATKVSGGC